MQCLHATMGPWKHEQFIIFIHACFLWTFSKSDASHCNPDQIESCKSAGVEGNIANVPEGGECSKNKYVEYTHVCRVTNYLPSADFCCCMQDTKIFCCRYHYNWNYFRCDQDEDVIFDMAFMLPTSSIPVSLEVLIPVVVLAALAILCAVVYCVRCCCCQDDAESAGTCGGGDTVCCPVSRLTYQDKSVQIEDPAVTAYGGDQANRSDQYSRSEHFGKTDKRDKPGFQPVKPPEYSILPFYSQSDSGQGSSSNQSASSDTTYLQPSAPPLDPNRMPRQDTYSKPSQYSNAATYAQQFSSFNQFSSSAAQGEGNREQAQNQYGNNNNQQGGDAAHGFGEFMDDMHYYTTSSDSDGGDDDDDF